MGLSKREWERWEELGLAAGNNGYVCGTCIGDSALSKFISENAAESQCSYCKRNAEEPFACSLSDVVMEMAEAISEEWADPANELPYDGREGGYQGAEVLDGWELLQEIGFEPEVEDLFNDIASYFTDREWCRHNAFRVTPSERLQFGWNHFCSVVVHHRRYTFWTDLLSDYSEYDPDYLPPGVMLAEIQEVIKEQSLIKELSAGTRFWRAVDHSLAETPPVPDRFTSPPFQCALQPNRMSPAGVSMFYGADTFETAVMEVCGKDIIPDKAASAVQFQTRRPFNLLDLASFIEPTSYFAPDGRDASHRTSFLRYFIRELSKPIERDKRQHIDYVPTQVLTEYVRYHMSAPNGAPIDGMRYLSSRNRLPCCVLFFDQDDCLRSRPGRPQALEYVPDSLRTIRLDHPRV